MPLQLPASLIGTQDPIRYCTHSRVRVVRGGNHTRLQNPSSKVESVLDDRGSTCIRAIRPLPLRLLTACPAFAAFSSPPRSALLPRRDGERDRAFGDFERAEGRRRGVDLGGMRSKSLSGRPQNGDSQ